MGRLQRQIVEADVFWTQIDYPLQIFQHPVDRLTWNRKNEIAVEIMNAVGPQPLHGRMHTFGSSETLQLLKINRIETLNAEANPIDG